MGAQQAGGLTQVVRVGNPNVIVEEDHSLPAEHVAEHQAKIALRAQIGPLLEDGGGQQPRRLQFGQPEMRRLGHVDRDQVDCPVDGPVGVPGACPFPAVQRDQRAAQVQRGAGGFLQVSDPPSRRHNDRVDLRPRHRLIGRPDETLVRSVVIGCPGAGRHWALDHSKSRVSGNVQSGVSVTPFSTVTRVSRQNVSLPANRSWMYSAFRSRKRSSVSARTAP